MLSCPQKRASSNRRRTLLINGACVYWVPAFAGTTFLTHTANIRSLAM